MAENVKIGVPSVQNLVTIGTHILGPCITLDLHKLI